MGRAQAWRTGRVSLEWDVHRHKLTISEARISRDFADNASRAFSEDVERHLGYVLPFFAVTIL